MIIIILLQKNFPWIKDNKTGNIWFKSGVSHLTFCFWQIHIGVTNRYWGSCPALIYRISLSLTGTGMMVQNGASSTLCSPPFHLLTGLLLLTLLSFSGLWSQPVCGLTLSGLKLKLSCVSVCVLGRGGRGVPAFGEGCSTAGIGGLGEEGGVSVIFRFFLLWIKRRGFFF